jgi:hypothetical protein
VVVNSVLPIRSQQAEPGQAAMVAKSVPHSWVSNLTETAYRWIAGVPDRLEEPACWLSCFRPWSSSRPLSCRPCSAWSSLRSCSRSCPSDYRSRW